MSTFMYRGIYNDGEVASGCRNAKDKEELTDYLQKKEIHVLDIFESSTKVSNGIIKHVSPKELSIFCKQISVMFYSDITILDGLDIIIEQTENVHLKTALKEIYDIMKNNLTFYQAISMYTNIFDSYFLNMISIGESSGNLDIVFVKMSIYYEKESRIIRKVKQAVTYPAILSIMMFCLVLLLIVEIIPMFSDLLGTMGGELPLITSWMLDVSKFIAGNALFIVISLIIAALFIIIYVASDKGKVFIDKAKLKTPIVRFIYTRIVVSRFSRSLAILLKSGVQILNAIKDLTYVVDNKYLKEKLEFCIEEIRNGKDVSKSLEGIGIFPPLFLRMVTVGEKTGQLDEMLERSSSIFDEEVEEALEKLTVLIEPTLIIILSVIVGIILLSVMLPMIEIMNAIG